MILGHGPLRVLSALLLVAATVLPSRAEPLAVETMRETRDRPLFAPSRRPPPPPPAPVVATPPAEPVAAAEPPPAPPTPPNAVLTGIVIGGDLKLAVFQADGKPLTVREGGEIEGWTVAEVQPRAVALERDGERTEMHLKDPAEATPGGAVPSGGEGADPSAGTGDVDPASAGTAGRVVRRVDPRARPGAEGGVDSGDRRAGPARPRRGEHDGGPSL